MWRFVILALLGLGLALGVTASVRAQAGAKAYAPEDLSGLTVPERIRVIELEYSEQSRGRRIPDDQMQFYLDQIRLSRWRFSRIKQDIAESLRGAGAGSGGGWGGGGGHPGPGEREILCESRDQKYVECRTGFRGEARLERQLSSTRCTEGQNWGSRPGLVWVRGGCRGRFAEDDRYQPPVGGGHRGLVCESRDDRYRECRTGLARRVRLVETLSKSPCVEGRSWGNKPGTVWVDEGCRGRFEEDRGGWGGGRGGGGNAVPYNVTCSSEDGGYRTCAWQGTLGRPQLIEQLSHTACIEGRTWGWDRREGLWVDRGCRGRFAPR